MTAQTKRDVPPRKKSGSAAQAESARIAKVIAASGSASRREAEKMVMAGRVKVNGQVLSSPAFNVLETDIVLLDGVPIPSKGQTRLWRYYKPAGIVSSTRDDRGRPTVFDNLPAALPRVVSVGRLDLNSEGLLLLTNSGELKRWMELPSTGWLRKYRVRAKGSPTEAGLERLRRGIVLDGETFGSIEATFDRRTGANAWFTVGIREGRNREIRRAFEAIGLRVNRLIRVSYGQFRLDNLAPGKVEEVPKRILRESIGKSFPIGGQPSSETGRLLPR